MSKENTKTKVLKTSREILASEGLTALSFDAIARRLGLTKQAVLYWYPTKQDLLAAMFLPWLENEADIAIRSVSTAPSHSETIEAFVKAVTAFHLEDLDRFRMMYLLPQTMKKAGSDPDNVELLKKVNLVTDRMYSALAGKLDGDPIASRQEALVIHASAVGLVVMLGLADSLGDPLKHSAPDLVNALIASLKPER